MVSSSISSPPPPDDGVGVAGGLDSHLSSNHYQFNSSCDGTSLNSSLSHGCLHEPRPHNYYDLRSSQHHRPFTSTSTIISAHNNRSEDGPPSVITVTPTAALHPPSSLKKLQQRRRRPTDYTTSSSSRPTAASLLLLAEHNRAIAENRRKSIEKDDGGRFESDMGGGRKVLRRRSSSVGSEAYHANLHDHQLPLEQQQHRYQQLQHQLQHKEQQERHKKKERRRSSLDRSEGDDDARRQNLKIGLAALKQQKYSKQRVSKHDEYHHHHRHHQSVHDEQNLLHHHLQLLQRQYHNPPHQQHQQNQAPPEATPEPTTTLDHPNDPNTTHPKKTKKKSHRAHRHHDNEDCGEELSRRKNTARRPSTYSEEGGGGRLEKVRYNHGGKEEEDTFSDRKYGTKSRLSSHDHNHHLHDKKYKEKKESRRSISSSSSRSMKPRRRRTSPSPSPSGHQRHYHDRKKDNVPTTTTVTTRTSLDLLSSLPQSSATTSTVLGRRQRYGMKHHVPATTSLHSQASDEAVVGIGVVPLVRVPPPPSSTPPIASTPIPTTPPSFYHPRRKTGEEQVSNKKSDNRIIYASSSSSSSSSTSSSSSSSSSRSTTFSNTSPIDKSSTSQSSSSVQGSVDITVSTDNDNSNSIDEETNYSSTEERYQQQRLEEYAGKRALRRLEQELADHSELSNPIPFMEASSSWPNVDSHTYNDATLLSKSGKEASGSNGNHNNSNTTTTTAATSSTNRSIHMKSSLMSKKSHRRILDRRKFNRVPQVKKSDLVIGEYLGRGNFCDVFEVTWILPEQQVQLQRLQQQWRQHHQHQSQGTQLQQSSTSTNNSSGSRSSRVGGDAQGTAAGTGKDQSSASTRNRSNSMHNLESSLESLALSCSNDLTTLFDDENDRLANRRSISQVRTSQSLDVGGMGLGDSGSGGEGGGGGSGWLRNPNVLALKCLRPAVRAQPRKFVIGAEDLAHETALLACLDHPNIIQLYGRAEGCFSTAFQTRPSTKNESPSSSVSGGGGGGGVKKKYHPTNEGYFIILDRLMSTLTDRIEEWKDECHAINTVSHVHASSNGGGRESTTTLPTSSLPVLPKIMPPETTLREHLCKRLKVAYCIADALDYLHTSHIVFRDLKPANVGFDCNDCVKMFDFGFATSVAPLLSQPYDGYGPLTETCGTRRYMAPEVALKLGYGKGVDVYSFGMLLWEICALDRPFNSIHTVEAFHDVVVLCGKRPSLKTDPLWPSSLKRLMSQCWDTDPLERPTMGEVKSLLCNVLRDVNKAIEKGDIIGGGRGKSSVSRRVGGTSSIVGGVGKTGSRQPKRQEGGNFIQKWKRRVTVT